VVEPHGAQTHALLQVVQPIGGDVNQASQSTWRGVGKEGAEVEEEKEEAVSMLGMLQFIMCLLLYMFI